MTEITNMKDMVRDIPKDVATIVIYVQNIFIHQHWSKAYGLELSEERKREPFIRSFGEKLQFLQSVGQGTCPLVPLGPRPNEQKMISICRDFSVAAVALCREAGIPARARCGFANYFEKGKYIDHWVLEYWNEERKKWVMVDAQLDNLQQEHLKIPFDPMNVGEDFFFTGPRAWQMCREGKENPELFGIFDWWGYIYLNCNLILDANSLLKMPMQPWDMWDGYKSLPMEKWHEKDYKLMDELASLALHVDDSLEDLIHFVQQNDKIKVPEDLGKITNSLE